MPLPQIIITLNRSDAVASVRSLLWKYGSAIEGEGNYKTVYNVEASTSDNVDNKVLNDSWDKWMNRVTELLEEFGSITTSGTGTVTFTLTTTNRWYGSMNTLKSLLSRYIEDGMMSDWLAVTAPSEAPMYSNRLADDVTSIKVELYKKGAPL